MDRRNVYKLPVSGHFMILGKIFGKLTTNRFQFKIEQDTYKFEFVQIMHPKYGWVLGQVYEIETNKDSTIAKCGVIGYKDDDGRVKQLRIPFDQGTEVLRAEDKFIKKVVKLETAKRSAYLGKLDGKDIDVQLDLSKILTKHVSVLAMSGAGKSYTVGVLLEEIMDKKIPLLIIDPHGEYSSLAIPNDDKKDIALMPTFKIKPKGYRRNIVEFGDITINEQCRPLKLSNDISPDELLHLIPGKLSNAQLGLLYSVIKGMNKLNFDNLLFSLEAEEGNLKWNLINIIDYLRSLNIFSENHTSFNELIQSGRASIINLKGIAPEIQEIIVYKLCKDLFEQRKKDKIPPFFMVIEEAHNFAPERSFGEAKSSKILRAIASEGRKFGLGLCAVTQRPARLDKSVISQCSTQIILKVTNPNDVKAIIASVEGITAETGNEVQNLPIGTAIVTGVTEIPLFVNIRPRKTKHGGVAVDILGQPEDKDMFEKIEDFKEKEMLPLIIPRVTPKEISLMSEKKIKQVHTMLIPAFLFRCEEKESKYNLLVEMIDGDIVVDIDSYKKKKLPELQKLSKIELKVLQAAHTLKRFSEVAIRKKTGIGFDTKDVLKSLIEKGFIALNGGDYYVTDAFILSKLLKYGCNNKIQFKSIDFTKKFEKKARLDVVKARLSRFTNVIDQQECFIIQYKPVFE